jgi:hypothetical protein
VSIHIAARSHYRRRYPKKQEPAANPSHHVVPPQYVQMLAGLDRRKWTLQEVSVIIATTLPNRQQFRSNCEV